MLFSKEYFEKSNVDKILQMTKKKKKTWKILYPKIEILYFDQAFSLRVLTKTLIFLFLNQNISCGYSKEPSRWDGSFEHPKYTSKLMGKKIFTILCSKNCLSKSVFTALTSIKGYVWNNSRKTVLSWELPRYAPSIKWWEPHRQHGMLGSRCCHLVVETDNCEGTTLQSGVTWRPENVT